jgi:cation diffusion facilitator family transporter
MSANGSLKSIIYALSANFAITIAKAVAAVITNSGAMLAEAIHSGADCTNQVLLLLGIKRAKRPPSDKFPLGYGKEIYFWSFIVAILLFSVGGMFSLYEGWHKLHQPQALNQPLVALGVLAFAIVAEGLSLAGCIREVNKVRGDKNLWQWFRDSRQSALLVIFGEDLAAMLGLVFAFGAVLVSMLTGNPLYDAIGTLAIGVLLIAVAILVGREVKDLLIGQGVETKTREQMQAFLLSQQGVDKVFNLVTLQLGDDVMVAVKAQMPEFDNTKQLVVNINQIEKAFRAAFPAVMWIFFEPDNRD